MPDVGSHTMSGLLILLWRSTVKGRKAVGESLGFQPSVGMRFPASPPYIKKGGENDAKHFYL